MDRTRPHRILVALRPAVLEGAIAVLLGDGRRNVVVQFHQASEADRTGPFDAAVVTREFWSAVHAGVVFTLPDTTEAVGVGVVTNGDGRREFEVRSPEQVIQLLGSFELAIAADAPAPAGPPG